MAEIVFTRPRVVEMPGQQNGNDNAVCTAAVSKCQLVVGEAAGIRPAAPGDADTLVVGVGLEKGGVAETIGYGTDLELSGFDPTGIVPMAPVYQSAAITGGLATGAQAKANAPKLGRISSDGSRIKIRTL
jgi:hypothetical protein